MNAHINWSYRDDQGHIATDRTSLPYCVQCYISKNHPDWENSTALRKDLRREISDLTQTGELTLAALESKDEAANLPNLYGECGQNPPNPRDFLRRMKCSFHYHMGLALAKAYGVVRKEVRKMVNQQELTGNVEVQLMGDLRFLTGEILVAATYDGHSRDGLFIKMDKKGNIVQKEFMEGTNESIEAKIHDFYST